MDIERAPSAAQTRAFAVAKLRRAASLPRMKDGRRPPMHADGTSEGERTPATQWKGSESDLSLGDVDQALAQNPDAQPTVLQATATDPEREAEPDPAIEQDGGESGPTTVEAPPPSSTPDPASAARTKRRSRSRSQSRGSRDFKSRARSNQSPTPSPLHDNESSQDDDLVGPQPAFSIPKLVSPRPSYHEGVRPNNLLASNTLVYPDGPFMYPVSTPGTPMPPTLEALQNGLQKGLFRSNSAAARMMAMHKLTGGADTYEETFPMPIAPSPFLSRNNTVSGGERSTARKHMLRRLGERVREGQSGTESPQPPSVEELSAGMPKRRRRRSRRSSTTVPPGGALSAGSALEDSDYPSTAANTPAPAPPTPLPFTAPDNLFAVPSRSPSTAPQPPPPPPKLLASIPSPSLTPPVEHGSGTASPRPTPSLKHSVDSNGSNEAVPRKRRSVFIEPEDNDPPTEEPVIHSHTPSRLSTPAENAAPPHTPPRFPMLAEAMLERQLRTAHSSNAPSPSSNDNRLSGVGVPVFLSAADGTPARRAGSSSPGFPVSPFGTPGNDRPAFREEEEEERVVYNQEEKVARSRQLSPFNDPNERAISWVAEPVPHSRMPLHDDEEADEPVAELSTSSEMQQVRSSVEERSLPPIPPQEEEDDTDLEERQPWREQADDTVTTFGAPNDDVTALAHLSGPSLASINNDVVPRSSYGSGSQHMRTGTPSFPSRAPSDRSIAKSYNDGEDRRLARQPSPSKRAATSAWEKVKNTFSRSNSVANSISRSNSAAGRHSRTLSSSRREHTDSSVSRESDTLSFKNESGAETSPSIPGSPSILAVSPQMASPATSHFPPPASADMLKYNNSKLFPFPGMKQLEEQRRHRGQGIPDSPSTPEATFAVPNIIPISVARSASSTSTAGFDQPTVQQPIVPQSIVQQPIVQQPSEPQSSEKFVVALPSQIISTPSNVTKADYFKVPTEGAAAGELPTSREGVRRWMSAKKLFPLSPNSPKSSPTSVAERLRDGELLSGRRSASPAISDRLNGRQTPPAVSTPKTFSPIPAPAPDDDDQPQSSNDLEADWEKVEKPESKQEDTTDSKSYFARRPELANEQPAQPPAIQHAPIPQSFEPARHFLASNTTPSPSDFPPLRDMTSSTTPDPMSSPSEYHARSTSNTTFSSRSSRPSLSHDISQEFAAPAADVLRRLDEIIGSGTRSPTWARVLDDPPRKLILSSPVVQVVNANTVKDRFLFLFTDIFIIASPIAANASTPLDSTRPDPSDRKVAVKNVVQLRYLRHSSERGGNLHRSPSHSTTARHPLIRAFVLQFVRDQDYALSTLFQKAGKRESSLAIGQLLASIPDIDRKQLGEYFCRRSSRSALHAYLDCFGFAGVRIDVAMRVFLHTVVIPAPTSSTNNPVDALLDAFASRWYDANKAIVAYDTQLAFRLVRAMVQLNEVMHGGISREPGHTGYPRSRLARRDFIDAFRLHDGRGLASDELLSNLYDSIRNERLSQARHPSSGGPDDIPITIKRALPKRLTFCEKSEPVVIRIPQADPHFAISLHGRGLTFEPPVLTFAKSSEASFRVTSSSLGATYLIMAREGPNATMYAGLPPSSPIVVERAFMRNTFNVAFLNHEGVKRRYMFSVNDALLRHQWCVSLERQINLAISAAPVVSYYGPSTFQTAAEQLAFKVLQETLLANENKAPLLPLDQAMDRLVSSASYSPNPKSPSSKASKEQRRAIAFAGYNSPRDLFLPTDSVNGASADQLAERPRSSANESPTPRLWSARDLQVLCQQNSSIGSVLSYLQVGPTRD